MYVVVSFGFLYGLFVPLLRLKVISIKIISYFLVALYGDKVSPSPLYSSHRLAHRKGVYTREPNFAVFSMKEDIVPHFNTSLFHDARTCMLLTHFFYKNQIISLEPHDC